MKNIIRIIMLTILVVPVLVIPQQWDEAELNSQQTKDGDDAPLQARDYEEFLDDSDCGSDCNG